MPMRMKLARVRVSPEMLAAIAAVGQRLEAATGRKFSHAAVVRMLIATGLDVREGKRGGELAATFGAALEAEPMKRGRKKKR